MREHRPAKARDSARPREADAHASAAALVAELASGHTGAGAQLVDEFRPDLEALATALRGDHEDSRDLATTAVATAVERVEEDPAGNAALAEGGPWDTVGFAGVALLALLEALGRPARMNATGMRELTLQERTVLLLVEVEGLDVDTAAALLHTDPGDVDSYLRSMREAMGLGAPPESPCAAWSRVRPTGTAPSPPEEARDHLEACDPCQAATAQLRARRDHLVHRLPGISWTQVGQAWIRCEGGG